MGVDDCLTHLSGVLNLPGLALLNRCFSTDRCSGVTSSSVTAGISLSISLWLGISLDDGGGTEAHEEKENKRLHDFGGEERRLPAL